MATETTSDSHGEPAVKQMDVDIEKAASRLIFDQAGSLEDGIREGVQNGVDAPGADEVQLVVQPSQQRTFIWDDGEGMDLSDGEVEEFLTVLFESTKDDEDANIGQFGIGFAQMMARAVVRVYTREFVVEFDSRQTTDWSSSPIDYRLFGPEEVADGHERMNPKSEFDGQLRFDGFDGFAVELQHYDDQVPASDEHGEWDDVQQDLRNRFEYLAVAHDVRVYMNGEDISLRPDEQWDSYETVHDDQVYIALRHASYGNVDVYSNGLKVTRQDWGGVKGCIVTKQNLSLNMSRDEIKADCPVWTDVKDKAQDLKEEILESIGDNRLNDAARADVGRMVREGDEDAMEREVFETANGETVSASEVSEHDKVAFAPKGHRRADKMLERGFMVLREPEADGSDPNSELKAAFGETIADAPQEMSIDQWASAHGVDAGYDTVADKNKWHAMMAVVETVNDVIVDNCDDVDRREVKFGEDEARVGWTDGDEHIVVTESAWSAAYTEGRVLEIWRHLCHEYAHVEDTEGAQGEAPHGDQYNRRYRQIVEATDSAASDLISEVKRNGKKGTVESYGHALSQYRG